MNINESESRESSFYQGASLKIKALENGTEFWLGKNNRQDFYNAEPLSDSRLSAEEKGRVLGGMAEQWSEQVDGSSIEARMWPRALAVAERMWSPQTVKMDENVTLARLQKASCQALERRGIRGGPVEPSFCPWSLHW